MIFFFFCDLKYKFLLKSTLGLYSTAKWRQPLRSSSGELAGANNCLLENTLNVIRITIVLYLTLVSYNIWIEDDAETQELSCQKNFFFLLLLSSTASRIIIIK